MAEVKDDDMDADCSYKAPSKVKVDELITMDADDPSLVKYKESLLKGAKSGERKEVTVKKLMLCVEGRKDLVLDLTGDLSKLKEKPMCIKEGCEYRLKIEFQVLGEIVSGLCLVTRLSRSGIKVEKEKQMVGSYAPMKKDEMMVFNGKITVAPAGMVSRGKYLAKSLFTDDDGEEYLKWEWMLEIKKDWPEQD